MAVTEAVPAPPPASGIRRWARRGLILLAVLAGVNLGAAVGFVFAAGPLTGPPGGPITAFLAGLGLMGLATCLGALLTLVTVGVLNAVVWYARLHFRLLKPAMEQA